MPVMTIRLTRRQSARIAQLARRRRVTRSTLVRDALDQLSDVAGRSAFDDWADTAGMVHSGVRDLATNPKHLKGFGQWRR